MVNIYALKDPENDQVYYVGRTMHKVEERLKAHICESKAGEIASPKCLWIMGVVSRGIAPLVSVLEVAPIDVAAERELYWINHYKLVNPELKNGKTGTKRKIVMGASARATIKKEPKCEPAIIRFTADEQDLIFSVAAQYNTTVEELIVCMAEHARRKRPELCRYAYPGEPPYRTGKRTGVRKGDSAGQGAGE